jgi:peroxiredoxin
VAKRAVFVLDGDREVRYAWVQDDQTQRLPMEELAAEIQVLRP